MNMNKELLQRFEDIKRSYQAIGNSARKNQKLTALELVMRAYQITPEAMRRLS